MPDEEPTPIDSAPSRRVPLCIGALARATGIPPETLRTWERRYGYPRPRRLPSGHRRYPAEAVERLRLVRQALDVGMKASQVLPASLDELQQLVHETLLVNETLGDAATAPTARPPAGSAEAWIECVVELDLEGLDQGLRAGLLRLGATRFTDEALVPFLEELEAGEVAGELCAPAASLARARTEAFLAGHWRPLADAARGPALLLLPFPGTTDRLRLHMLALVLAAEGLRVHPFDGPVPPEQLTAAAIALGADAVVVVPSRDPSQGSLAAAVEELVRGLGPDVELVVAAPGVDDTPSGVRWLEAPEELTSWASGCLSHTPWRSKQHG